MKIVSGNSYEELCQRAAVIFSEQIRKKPDSVLGLATGSTPLGLYRELVRLYEAGRLDFSQIRTVNLDEYYPLRPEHPQSYHYYMQENLFGHVNLRAENCYLPDGAAPDPALACVAYDQRIEQLGGIDLQLLGLGENGHIGFNEPGSELCADTHLTELSESTVHANARFFDNEAEVPRRAITMGMAGILKARRILLIAYGKKKHTAVAALLDNRITPQVPATLLKLHPDVTVLCDGGAFLG